MIRFSTYLSLFALVLASRAVHADPFSYSSLNLPRAGVIQAILFILLCGALIGGIVVYEMLKVRRQRRRENSAVETRFVENAKRFGLDYQERLLLRSIERHTDAGDPNALFDTVALFEQAVDAEVSLALASNAGEAESLELEELLQSLRKKLHFTILDDGLPIPSTRNMAQGQKLWVLGPRKSILGEATVALVREFFFSVKLSPADFAKAPAFQSPILLAFTRKADGIYGIEAPLIAFDRGKGILKCRHTMKFKRNQLRQDVRVETDIQIGLRCISSTKDAGGKVADRTPFMARMTDVSGGGFAFVSERELSNGDQLLVTAALPKLGMSGLRAKIVGATRHNGSQHILFHAQFNEIDFEKKETIVRYVFARLREINQK
jgi:hypothetical protein